MRAERLIRLDGGSHGYTTRASSGGWRPFTWFLTGLAAFLLVIGSASVWKIGTSKAGSWGIGPQLEQRQANLASPSSPSPLYSPSPSNEQARPTIVPTALPVPTSPDVGTNFHAIVGAYGWADNNPPGTDIAYPNIHTQAGGTGTFQDPVTLATDPREIASGTLVYYPSVKKYFVMEDNCPQCTRDWNDGNRARVTLWIGGDSNSMQDPENTALATCYRTIASGGDGNFQVAPPAGLAVDATPFFDPRTLTCHL